MQLPSQRSQKELLSNGYNYYCEFKGYKWIRPKFKRVDVPIFLPHESELDVLIADTRDKLSVLLQLLKETGIDSSEAWRLGWIDIGAGGGARDSYVNRNPSARPIRNETEE